MGLITCSECGKQISDRATTCPHCGAPVETTRVYQQPVQQQPVMPMQPQRSSNNAILYIIGGIVAMIVVAVICFLVVSLTNSKNEAQQAQQQLQQEQQAQIQQAKDEAQKSIEEANKKAEEASQQAAAASQKAAVASQKAAATAAAQKAASQVRHRAVIQDPDGYTNVRSGKSSSSPIVKCYYDDEMFYYSTISGSNWVKVYESETGGSIGYMYGNRVRRID